MHNLVENSHYACSRKACRTAAFLTLLVVCLAALTLCGCVHKEESFTYTSPSGKSVAAVLDTTGSNWSIKHDGTMFSVTSASGTCLEGCFYLIADDETPADQVLEQYAHEDNTAEISEHFGRKCVQFDHTREQNKMSWIVDVGCPGAYVYISGDTSNQDFNAAVGRLMFKAV